MIEFQNVDFSYNKDFSIIENLSFKVPENSIFGFLGANGAGKTTAIRLLLNLYQAKKGKIWIQGKEMKTNGIELYRNIGTLIENPTFYGHLTAYENLKLLAKIYEIDKERVEEVLDLVGLLGAKDKKAKKYSLGMKQRLGIASSILHNPEILILDEPLNGLDPKGISEMRALFFKFQKEDKKTLFISSHILTEIEATCTDLCIIDKGKGLFTGKIEELANQLSSGEEYTFVCSDTAQVKTIFSELKLSFREVDNQTLKVIVENEKIIPTLIANLVEAKVELFEVRKNASNLESLYLKLTK